MNIRIKVGQDFFFAFVKHEKLNKNVGLSVDFHQHSVVLLNEIYFILQPQA